MSGTAERNARMAEMFRQGLTLQAIAGHFGVTRQRVSQILTRAGIKSDAGGMKLKAAMRRETQRRMHRARIEARWDVSFERWKECRRNGLVRRYEQHRQNSSNRGIPFYLTFGEWLSIWEASGHINEMGRGKDKFCMCRISDSGAYEVGNVHIQTIAENSREATKKWIGKTKENRGVFHLYPGLEKGWQAKVGRVSLGYFATEAEAVAARSAAMGGA